MAKRRKNNKSGSDSGAAQFQEDSKAKSRRNVPLDELGAVGQGHSALFSSLSDDEYLSELRWPYNVNVYNKMRRSDSQVAAMLLVMELPLRATKWYVKPYSDDPKDVQIAEFIEENLFAGPPHGMTQHWDDFLRLALTMFPFGHSVFEKVFEIKNGYVRWRKFAQRPPKTIYDFNYDESGGPLGIKHLKVQGHSYGYVDIPIEKLLLFTHRMEGGDLRGSSVLRAAYKHWKIKDFLYKILNIGIERFLVGTPTMELPEGYADEDRKLARQTVEDLRSSEKGGALIPPGFKLDLFESKRSAMDIMPYITHQDLMIVRGVLAQFINLGSGGSGSWALSKDQSDLFLMCLNANAKYLANTINSHAIPQLVDWNWDVEGYPKLSYKPIGDEGDRIIKVLTDLSDGKLLVPDDNIEEWLRDMLELPEKGEPLFVPAAAALSEKKKDGKGKQGSGKEHKHSDTCRCVMSLEEHKAARRFAEDGTRRWRRDLTAQEKRVNFAEMEKVWDTEEELFVQEGSVIVGKQLQDLFERVRKALEAGNYDELAKIPVRFRGEFTSWMSKQQRGLIDFGIEQAATELGLDKDKIRTPGEDRKIAAARSGVVADLIAQRIKSRFVLEVLAGLGGGATLKAALFAGRKEAEELAGRELKGASSAQVGEAINQGRDLAAARAGVRLAQYSAILDDSVCPLCEYLDGMVIETDNPDYDRFTPQIHQHCRCVWVYVLPDEEPQPDVTWESPGEDMVVDFGSMVN